MQKTGKKLTDYYHIIAAIIFFGLFLILYQSIFMYSDDFRYGEAGKGNLIQIVQYMGEHYRTVNGRTIVHTLAILFTKCDLFFWRLVTPAVIALLLLLTAKWISADKKEYQKLTVIMLFLYLFMPVGVLQQSAYWLSGSFNYVYPMLPILGLGILMKNSIQHGKANYWLLPLGFLAGASMEQCGMIALGICILTMLYQKFFEKKRLLLCHYLTVLITAVGYITIFLSPATKERVGQESGQIGLFQNTYRILFEKWFQSKEMFLFVFITIICMTFWLVYFTKKSVGWRWLNIACLAILLLFLPFMAMQVFHIGYVPANIVSRGITFLFGCTFYFSLAYLGILLYLKNKKETVLICTILAFGSQFMLIAARYIGFRNNFPSMLLLFPFLAETLLQWLKSISAEAKSTRVILKIGGVFLLVFALMNTCSVFYGYSKNAQVYQKNLDAIQAYHENPEDVLNLWNLPYQDYRWYLPMDDETGWQEKAFKTYYHINDGTKVIFQNQEKKGGF